jgi:hypothetical protein
MTRIALALALLALATSAQAQNFMGGTGGGTPGFAGGTTYARCAPGYITKDPACSPQPRVKAAKRKQMR